MEVQNFQVMEIPVVSENNYAFKKPLTVAEIEAWIISYLTKLLEVEPDEIDVTIPFDHYGLDSSAAIGLTGDMENWLGCELDPTLLYDYPTIKGLAEHLALYVKT